MRAFFYRSVLRRHRQSGFEPKAARPQLLDKSRELTAVPEVGQYRFDLARSAHIGIKNIDTATPRCVKAGKILFEVGVGLDPRADPFLDVVTMPIVLSPALRMRSVSVLTWIFPATSVALSLPWVGSMISLSGGALRFPGSGKRFGRWPRLAAAFVASASSIQAGA